MHVAYRYIYSVKKGKSSTTAYELFKDRVGDSTQYIISIYIGLLSVQSGVARKPDDLRVSWNPKNLESAAQRARIYALQTSLVWLIDSVAEYIDNVLKLPGVLNESERARLNDHCKSCSGIAEKINFLSTILVDEVMKKHEYCEKCQPSDEAERKENYNRLINCARCRPDRGCQYCYNDYKAAKSLTIAAITMRNAFVHRKKNEFDNKVKQVMHELKNYRDYIGSKYCNFDIEKFASDWIRGVDVSCAQKVNRQRNASITLKECLTIVTSAKNFVRYIDMFIVNKIDFESLVDEYLQDHFSALGRSHKRKINEIWGAGDSDKAFYKILKILKEFRIEDDEQKGENGHLRQLSCLSYEDALLQYPAGDGIG